MVVLNFLIAFLVMIILIVSGYRFMVYYRIRQLEKDVRLTGTTRRKLLRIKQKEHENHLQVLLINGLLMGSTMLCLTISLLLIDEKVVTLRAQNEVLKEEMHTLKQEQQQLLTKTPVKDYPKEGIGLSDHPWGKVFETSDNRSLQSEIENTITQKLPPYFGLSTFVLSIDVPSKTLSLSLVGNAAYSANQPTIQKNIKAFVKEAESIQEINQIQFQIDALSSKNNVTIYQCTYGRDDVKKPFELLNEEAKGTKGD